MSIFSSSTWNRWRTKVESGAPVAAAEGGREGGGAAPSAEQAAGKRTRAGEGSPSRSKRDSPSTNKRSSLSLEGGKVSGMGSPSRARRRTVTDSNAEAIDKMKEEYERRIRVLSSCLETKAEENITLNEQLDKAKRRMDDMEGTMKEMGSLQFKMNEMKELLDKREAHAADLAEALSAAELDKLQAQDAIGEYERRIQVLSTCLEDMASENLSLAGSSSSSLQDSPSGTGAGAGAREGQAGEEQKHEEAAPGDDAQRTRTTTLSQPVQSLLHDVVHQDMEVAHKLREELESVKKALAVAEKRIVTLNTKLMESVNKKLAAEESNEMYENKLKSLEKDMMENLHQEGIRRQEAEYVVSKLRKKVAELQFLLDERDQGSSDDDYDSDE